MATSLDFQLPGAEDPRVREARARLARHVAGQMRINDARIVDAFARVPRHRFVPQGVSARAYEDVALPLGYGQTISQPSMIAVMLNALALQPTDRVLEVGAGSGYAAALLGQLVQEVYAVEIIVELAQPAQRRMSELGIGNVHVFQGNGRQGLPAFGPYDKILVSAGSAEVPEDLVQELVVGGRIAIPVGDHDGQQLLIGKKEENGQMHWESSIPCIFVPLVGQA